jgi:hypothetical protein
MNPMLAPLAIFGSVVLASGMAQSGLQPSAPMISVISQPVAMTNVEVTKEGRRVSVPAQFVKVRIHRPPSYQEEMAYVLMLRESLTGLYWWKFQYAAPGEATADLNDPVLDKIICFTNDRAVGFSFWGHQLHIRDVQGRMPDFLTVQKTALAGLERFFLANDSPLMPGDRELNLLAPVGEDFFHIAGHAEFVSAVVSAVAYANGRWNITLKGPNKDFAEVTLDEGYVVRGVRRWASAP